MIPFAGALLAFYDLFTALPGSIRLYIISMILLSMGINLLVLAVRNLF